MRILLGLCVVLLLGGCNRVHTDHPLFFASDAPDAPRLRDGVWLIEDGDDDCRFDERKPATRWPDCADWMLVRGGEMLGYDREEGGPGEWTSLAFVLAAGDPLVLQIAMTDEGKPDYQYFGIEGEAAVDGRITALVSWPVQCGPPPPKAAAGEKPRYVTLEPLPGMTLADDSCTADSAGTVRNAARASRAWEPEPGMARWVRDGYP